MLEFRVLPPPPPRPFPWRALAALALVLAAAVFGGIIGWHVGASSHLALGGMR